MNDGATQLNKMLLALGYAFYEWQNVERALVGVLRAVFEDSAAYVFCFYELKGIAGLNFIKKSLRSSISLEDLEKWKILQKYADIAIKDRNAFAHHELSPTIGINSECQYLLIPSIMDRSRYDENFDPKEEPYTYEDMWESIELFRALANNLGDFSDSINWLPMVRAVRNERLKNPKMFPVQLIQQTSRSKRHEEFEKKKKSNS